MPPNTTLSAEHPFPGLRPYDFGDHGYFFGREDQTYSLFRLLDRSKFIAVVGASGSGKSSLVRAGLLPLLDQESKEVGGRSWHWTQMRPGDAPLANLAACLASLARDESPVIAAARRERIAFELRRSSLGMREALGEIEELSKSSLVIVIDQFEELFRYASTGAESRVNVGAEARWREEAVHFVQLLLQTRGFQQHDVHVLITMRSDFIGDCARFHGLPEAISATQYLVPSLTRDQLEEVIRKPVEKVGAAIESQLIQRLINDSGDDMDELPVLQHCLLRLWEQAGHDSNQATAKDAGQIDPPRELNTGHYDAIGGIAHALSQHADEILAGLEGQELVVEQVFRALSELDKEGRAIRRALPFFQLLAESGTAEAAMRQVLERFRANDCSFLVPSPAAVPRLAAETRIDVGHEALLRRWQRVSAAPSGAPDQEDDIGEKGGWLRREDEDGRLYRGLLALAYSGGNYLPLNQVEKFWTWWTARPRTAAWALRYGGSLDRVESLFERSRAALAGESKRQAAAQEAERALAAAKQRRQRRIFIFSSAGLITAVILVAVAFGQWQAAKAEHDRAQNAFAAMYGMWANQNPVLNNKLAPGSTIHDQLRSDASFDDPVAAARNWYALSQIVAKTDPENQEFQYTLAINARTMGDVLDLNPEQRDSPARTELYRHSVDLLEPIVAKHPENQDWKRQLSISYDRLGDRLVSDDLLDQAEPVYRKSLATSEALSAKNPTEKQLFLDRAISYEKVANVLSGEGKPGPALDAYRATRDIWQKLVDTWPSMDGTLSLALAQAKIAELESDSDQAVSDFRQAITALMRLNKDYPTNTKLRWSLMAVQDEAGNALTAKGDAAGALVMCRAALTVVEGWAKASPRESGFQIDLAMRHGRIGDLLKTSGDLAGGLREYQTKEALVEALAKSQPDNSEWQADLAETNKKIGDTLVAQGNQSAALTAYTAALAIRETLAKANAKDAAAQIELVLANWVLAAQGDDPAGRLAFIEATLRQLDDARQLTASQAQWLPTVENQLSKLQQN